MSITHKPRGEELEPTAQYKAAIYGLKCGDSDFAETYLRNQPKRSRSVHEFLDIADKLGLLNEKGRALFGLSQVQLSFDESSVEQVQNGNGGNGHGKKVDHLELAKEKLRNAGQNGLKIFTIVGAIGRAEGIASPQPQSYRNPIAAELNEYADEGELVCIGDRFYLPEHAPDT